MVSNDHFETESSLFSNYESAIRMQKTKRAYTHTVGLIDTSPKRFVIKSKQNHHLISERKEYKLYFLIE